MKYELRDRIATVTLSRPGSLNAVNAAMADALGAAWTQADDDPEVSVIVITGEGRAFCAGADLKALDRGEKVVAQEHPEWGFAGVVRHWVSKPVIAAVNGLALGGGAEIMLAADLAVADESSTIALPEVRLGLLAAGGGLVRLPRRVEVGRALELALTGDPITAVTAEKWGLINRVVADGSALSEAMALAARIAANAPLSVVASKQLIYQNAASGVSEWNTAWRGLDPWQTGDAIADEVYASGDAREGPRSFAEKRAPRWQGR